MPAPVVVLGPQRPTPNLAMALEAVGVEGLEGGLWHDGALIDGQNVDGALLESLEVVTHCIAPLVGDHAIVLPGRKIVVKGTERLVSPSSNRHQPATPYR